MHRDSFSSFHPVVNFTYFALVLVFTMFFMHPVSLIISLVASLIYAISLNGRKTVRFSLVYLLPMMFMAAVINPAFNHEGATILAYLPTGNPLTFESIIYGFASATMLAAVITWFSCYNAVMTSDKFVYLFGRIIPALSLLLSMTLRFVPKFKVQFKVVSEAQRCIRRDTTNENLLQRVKDAITVLSIMVTWSLENAIETADSMKSRGYGLPGRTAFSIYRFDGRDKTVLCWLFFCGFYIFSGWMAGGLAWQYYPIIKGVLTGAFPISFQLVYLALCLTPVMINKLEVRIWKRLQCGTEPYTMEEINETSAL